MMQLKKKEIILDNTPGKLDIQIGKQVYTYDVVFGPTNYNYKSRERSIWLKNIHGKVMAVPLKNAKYFLSKRAEKYQAATIDELPMTPTRKIYPTDFEKTRRGQDRANTNLTGREVEEMINEGEEVLVSELSWPQLKKKAKDLGVNTYQKTRMEIEEEVNAKLQEKA